MTKKIDKERELRAGKTKTNKKGKNYPPVTFQNLDERIIHQNKGKEEEKSKKDRINRIKTKSDRKKKK